MVNPSTNCIWHSTKRFATQCIRIRTWHIALLAAYRQCPHRRVAYFDCDVYPGRFGRLLRRDSKCVYHCYTVGVRIDLANSGHDRLRHRAGFRPTQCIVQCSGNLQLCTFCRSSLKCWAPCHISDVHSHRPRRLHRSVVVQHCRG